MFKVKNKNTRTTYQRSLTLNIFHTFYKVSVFDFEQVNVSWVMTDFNQRATPREQIYLQSQQKGQLNKVHANWCSAFLATFAKQILTLWVVQV